MDPHETTDAEILEPQEPEAPPIYAQPKPVSRTWSPMDDTPDWPVRLREILAVLALVVAGDLTIYRGQGFAGLAAFMVLGPAFLWMGSYQRRGGITRWIVGGLLVAIVAKLLWCGSMLAAGLGVALLIAFAMSLVGLRPYVLEMAVYASQAILAGYAGLIHYWRSAATTRRPVAESRWLNFLLPAAAMAVFSLLFVMANPDLLDFLGQRMSDLVARLSRWVTQLALRPTEILFWFAMLWLAIGLLRPVVRRTLLEEGNAGAPAKRPPVRQSPVYPAFRNTLVTVIALFAIYLVFEFSTLWFRVFPPGFHYSGYAHEGAAWLTVALAVATAMLSFVFRGEVLRDPRLAHLHRLAWVWSIENLALAVAVYHRLLIYVDFNGMSRMRTVGFFGISTVVIGFALVLWKISQSRDFIWLVHRQLWALALAIYVFALTPVDTLVVRYNVDRIMRGDPAPSVQISVHPIGSEGLLLLRPLLDCPDPLIREGVRAMLAERDETHRKRAEDPIHWTSWQMADTITRKHLARDRSRWREYRDLAARDKALNDFHEYAYQWY